MYQMQGYKFEKTSTDHGLKIVYAKTRTARSGPPAGGGAPRPALAAPPPRLADRREPERYESRGGGYDDGRDSYQRDPYESHGGGNRRFDGREHSDRYHDDYEDSERGDDDFFQRDANSMEGLTD